MSWLYSRALVEAYSEECSSDSRQAGGRYWESEPDVGRVVNGMAARVDRLKAIGNGQCPQAMALAWNMLSEGLI